MKLKSTVHSPEGEDSWIAIVSAYESIIEEMFPDETFKFDIISGHSRKGGMKYTVIIEKEEIVQDYNK